MPLSAGTRLGPYEIVAPLGAGGMGEVYRARDPRMGREVAIKVCAERFSDRLEREVHAIAVLNHPNICHIYDVGPNYLVLELVEGPTLAERIQQGAIPLEEALPVARQIADALEAAHENGIIHRDLKPANIKLKPDGTVKVLDFGLAKVAEQIAAAGNPEESPTVAMGGTLAGQIVGTAAYMAPEQARGKPVDKRADIWAFGVVLYEMLTGRMPFAGETVTDTLAGVLTKEPDWHRVPAQAERLLKSCLDKEPKRRLRDIGDAWRLLENAPARTVATARLPWGLAAALALALAVALLVPRRTPTLPSGQPDVPIDLDLGPDVSFGTTIGPAVVLSPDGTRLVFVSDQGGTPRLFTRRLDQATAALLPGTEGAYTPFLSPDGQWVAFFAAGKMKKTRIDGGEPVALCDAPSARGGSWGDDGNIVAALDPQGGLSRVPAEGGKPLSLTSLNMEAGENTHRWPHVLPGSKAVIFSATVAYGDYDESKIVVVSLNDRHTKTLLEHGGMYPRYLPTGHLVYTTKGTLFAVRFDPDRLRLLGPGVTLGGVSSNRNLGFAQIDFSRTGTFVYRTGGDEGLRTMNWLDQAGKTESLGFDPALYLVPRLSPDGTRLAYLVSQGSATDLWVYDFARGIKTRVTNGENAYHAVWSRDGQFVIFYMTGGLYWTRADGGAKPQQLTPSKRLRYPNSVTPDGTQLMFAEQMPAGGSELRTVTIDGASGHLRAGEPQLFIKITAPLAFPTFSPDGRWVAYADAEAGTYEVYVRAFPDNGTKVQISSSGGTMPVWSPNGHELFYRTVDGRIMAANYSVKGQWFVAGKPRLWFDRQLANIGLSLNFDLAPDGNRFLVLMPLEVQSRRNQSHVMLVTNFFDEVRRLVPTQGN